MKFFFRPSLLIAVAAALVVGAAAVVFLTPFGNGVSRPVPLPVGEGDCEVAYLYAATNASSWERFVSAVRRAAKRLQDVYPGLEAQVTAATFPQQTTAVPEVAISWPGSGRRLVFRWYKLTSDWNTRDWLDALLARRPPPLAVIGGSSSDGARELAGQLNQLGSRLPEEVRPLLLLTTATADRVARFRDEAGKDESKAPVASLRGLPESLEPDATPGVHLNRIYPGRTFRFCFTNRQMAAAVTHFLWSQDDLRPDSDPVYMVRWDDDSYSRDLIEGFWKALRLHVIHTSALEWAWVTGTIGGGAFPPVAGGGAFPLHRAGALGSSFAMSIPPTPQVVDSSVGSFDTPNHFETKVAGDLVKLLLARPAGTAPPGPRLAIEGDRGPGEGEWGQQQRRPLLVITGQSQPSRRFLRQVVRDAPRAAHRLVVATGDAISFNTVYRDREVTWPIQDLPFALVFFCHYNPVDAEAGFRPVAEPFDRTPDVPDPVRDATAATGTEDILLYGTIVEALAQAYQRDGRPAADAAELGRRLATARLRRGRIGFDPEGMPLFRRDGKRRSGTGEHIVCVRPRFGSGRVLPRSTVEVWSWQTTPGSGPGPGRATRSWRRCGGPLTVTFGED